MNKDIKNLKEKIYKESKSAIKGLNEYSDILEINVKDDCKRESIQKKILTDLMTSNSFLDYSIKLDDGVFQLDESGIDEYLSSIA